MHSDASSANALIAGFAAMWLFMVVVVLASVVFVLWMYWRIFEKAGFSGALSLLNLVPGFGSLICLIILSFSEWPSQHNGGPMVQPQYMPPPPPPTPPQQYSGPPQQYGGPPQPLE